ncbi:MAG: helix-turn-helix transcriptional regulator [Hespellia sp.]|nr:helix-turn-helix transcriptional regulator [Hespellia sp.]
MAIDYRLIGQRIKKNRLKKGTTQEHFAEAMDVSVGYISQLERGITKISLDRLAIVAHYLDCPISELIENTSTIDSEYANDEFRIMYQQLNAKEKILLFHLLKTYLNER